MVRPEVPRGTLATGDALAVDDLALRVVWPDAGKVPAEPADTGMGINNVSIVLLGEVDGRRFLLTGDAEQAVDAALAALPVDTSPGPDASRSVNSGAGSAAAVKE